MLRLGPDSGANLAILAILSAAFQLLGIEDPVLANGVELYLSALLTFLAVTGFAGSLISLFLSNAMVKTTVRDRLEPRRGPDRRNSRGNSADGHRHLGPALAAIPRRCGRCRMIAAHKAVSFWARTGLAKVPLGVGG